MTKHLIIGGGPAAINAAETIREVEGEESDVTLICDEPAYSRMVLPYYLADQIPEKQVYTGDTDYFQRLKVNTLFGSRVTKIEPQAKKVTLQNGHEESFDNLIIATGSSAVVPPIPGADLPGVHPLWTLSHTEAVLNATQGLENPEVLFVGAGFIGFIVLNAAYKRGWKLTVVEQETHVLPRMLNAQAAELVEAWLRNKDVGLHLGTTVTQISEENGRKQVSLSSGETLTADVVIIATGIRANLDLVDGSGIATDQGILVNSRMQTNFPFIYAAGDVAQGPDLLSDQQFVHAIQPTAVDHGRIAGANAAGHDVEYRGSLLMNILDVCGLQCASFGRWNEETEEVTICNPSHPVYRRLLWTEDRITGAVFVGPASEVGMLNDVGMVQGIIRTQAALGAWKQFLLQNPFDVRRPYVAAQVAKQLVGMTLLGRASKPRNYRYQDPAVKPQVTMPDAHKTFVETKP